MDTTPVEQPRPPRVTALIVSRNCAGQLQTCLEALDGSVDRDRLEIVVIDNGSEDKSADIPHNFPSVQSMRLPKNFGWTKAANIGMRTAKGDAILFLPPNVIVEPDTISRLATRLDDSESLGAVYPFVDRWYRLPDRDALAQACRTGELPNPQPTPTDAAEVAVDYAPGAPMLVRKIFLRGMNYFDERFGESWSDLELCWQLRNAGKAILVLPQVRVQYGPECEREQDAVHLADRKLGAAAYLGKHFGSAAGVKFRVSAALGALGKAQFSELSAIVSGQKIDGTHL
ncbi:MAG TPA: glycosyltransferase [Bryobacteraceae bacterium]|nr:glycosyltransferase [Bryobacteraceae bacterium]